jgi:GTP pyrophosphokinase
VLQSALEAEQIDATVAGRPKRMFSIQRKLERTGVALGEIYDVRALRIIVADVPACYAALNVVHQIYRPIPGELDDYIASPKGNGYRSLHTAARDERGRPFEIQIRTRAMHRTAEMGSAAHWRYKELTAAYGPLDAEPAPFELRYPVPLPLETTAEEVEEPVH